MIGSLVLALILLVGLLTLVSYVDRVYQEAGKFLSREFQDNIDVFEDKIEAKLGVIRTRAALSMAVLEQLTTAAIAVLFAYLIFRDPDWRVYELLQAAFALVLIVLLCNRFLPFVFFSRTRGEWLSRWTLVLRGLKLPPKPLTR